MIFAVKQLSLKYNHYNTSSNTIWKLNVKTSEYHFWVITVISHTTKGVLTVESLKLYQHYFIDFINPFPGYNIRQTFIIHTPDVTTGHDDIDKMIFVSSWFYIKYTEQIYQTNTVSTQKCPQMRTQDEIRQNINEEMQPYSTLSTRYGVNSILELII